MQSNSDKKSTEAKFLDAKGRFKAKQQLGEGTYATVFAAHDTETDKEVAVKVFKSSEMEAVAVNELKYMVQLSGVVPASAAFFSPDRCMSIVMPRLSSSLGKEIAKRRICIEEAIDIMYQLLKTLAGFAALRVAHGDLKPDNIMLVDERSTRIQVIDLGLVNRYPLEEVNEDTLNIQTIYYRAPEVTLGAASLYGPPMDVWSAACIGAEMIACRALFAKRANKDLLIAHTTTIGMYPDSIMDLSVDPETVNKWFSQPMQEEEDDHASRPAWQWCLPGQPATNANAELDRFFPDMYSREKTGKICSKEQRKEYISFLAYLLDLNPLTRPSASDALKHTIFRNLKFSSRQ